LNDFAEPPGNLKQAVIVLNIKPFYTPVKNGYKADYCVNLKQSKRDFISNLKIKIYEKRT
jgi:hypothetical protein